MGNLRYFGFIKEDTFGTEKAGVKYHLDIVSGSIKPAGDPEIIYEGSLGRSNRIHRPGYYSIESKMEYGMDINTILYFLYYALGGYIFTEKGALDLHEVYGSDNAVLPSITGRLGEDNYEKIGIGLTIDTMEITIEGEICKVSIGWVGVKDGKGAVTAKSDLVLPTAYPLAFHEVSTMIDGVNESAKLKKTKISIKNNIDVEGGQGQESRYPYKFKAKKREIGVSLEFNENETTQLEKFWGGATGPAATGAEDFTLIITFNAGADGTMIFKLPKFTYDKKAEDEVSGADPINPSLEGSAYADSVTLDDGVTSIETDVYIKINNKEAAINA